MICGWVDVMKIVCVLLIKAIIFRDAKQKSVQKVYKKAVFV